MDEIFHVHTKRCKHATGEDREYVDSAIRLGAKRIVFVDHVPFPGDPFGHRMDMSQYDEYLDTMTSLKDEYEGKIEILKGFEIEYFPSFRQYYEELREDKRIDVMVLGQHMYEFPDGSYSFSLTDRSSEFVGLVDAICEGKESGLFDVVAHPERAFKRCKGSERELPGAFERLRECLESGICVEYNYASRYEAPELFEAFWRDTKNVSEITHGYDAHSVEEMKTYWESGHR